MQVIAGTSDRHIKVAVAKCHFLVVVCTVQWTATLDQNFICISNSFAVSIFTEWQPLHQAYFDH